MPQSADFGHETLLEDRAGEGKTSRNTFRFTGRTVWPENPVGPLVSRLSLPQAAWRTLTIR
jgi:hypothetical protein